MPKWLNFGCVTGLLVTFGGLLVAVLGQAYTAFNRRLRADLMAYVETEVAKRVGGQARDKTHTRWTDRRNDY